MSKEDNSARRVRYGGKGGRHHHGMMPGEKPKDFKRTMKTLLRYMKPYKILTAFVFLFAAISTVFSIISPAILGSATDVIVQGVLGDGVDFDALLTIIMLLLVLYLISSLFAYLQEFIMTGVSQRIIYKLRKEMSEKVDRLPLKYFDKHTQGEVLSRFTNDIDTINSTLNNSLTQMITNIITIIGVLVMMLSINVIMTISALIILPLSAFLIKAVVMRSQKHFKNHQKYLGDINGYIEEMYSGHIIIKAFNGEEESIKEFKEINNKLTDSAWRSQFLSGLMMPLMGFVGNLAYVFVCVIGGFLAIRGAITIGNIQAFMQYIRFFHHPIAQTANVVNILQSTAAAAERVFEFLSEEEEVAEDAQPLRPDLDKIAGEVCFNNVTFGYSEDALLIKDFSYCVKPGQKIAIVGPTGAGKTTIVKLLMRFYELNRGEILIDGFDIKRISRNDLHEILGMVLQDTWLFNGTIMENIRYGNIHATDEQVYEAAAAAHIDHFIHTLPEGYDTVINEDASNISQGQKQLLTIARAILSDNPILILDEATSSVDTRTEILIQKAMNTLMKGRTSFIIAHRLSTIKDADVILVMNNGDIIEKGNHQELMAKQGFYADLYNSQFDI
jgi:ATP-binding cassette subfamily B multidrug efflux pump